LKKVYFTKRIVLLKKLATHYRKATIIVTIKERIMRIKGVKSAQFTLIFVGNGSRAGTTQVASSESVSLRG